MRNTTQGTEMAAPLRLIISIFKTENARICLYYPRKLLLSLFIQLCGSVVLWYGWFRVMIDSEILLFHYRTGLCFRDVST